MCLEVMENHGMLTDIKVNDFLGELASGSPAPGGGGVAALSGALASALSAMVCNLTVGKKKFQRVSDELTTVSNDCKDLRKNLVKLVDEDARALSKVMAVYKMPRENDRQALARKKAIREAMQVATEIPLKTMRECHKVLELTKVVAEKGNPNAITDAGIAALMSQAAIKSAAFNVRVNLKSIKDEKLYDKYSKEMEGILTDTDTLVHETLEIVNSRL